MIGWSTVSDEQLAGVCGFGFQGAGARALSAGEQVLKRGVRSEDAGRRQQFFCGAKGFSYHKRTTVLSGVTVEKSVCYFLDSTGVLSSAK